MTKEVINPHDKRGQKVDRWAKAQVVIRYVDTSGDVKTITHEFKLEDPIAAHPNYKVGIAEL